MESFLLHSTASQVPDVIELVKTVDKRPGNVFGIS